MGAGASAGNTAGGAAALPAACKGEGLTIVIFGATGDLARKKLYPALSQLLAQGLLPPDTNIVGYGRRPQDLEAMLDKQCVNVDPKLAGPLRARCSYFQGLYDKDEDFQRLQAKLGELATASGEAGDGACSAGLAFGTFIYTCRKKCSGAIQHSHR